MNRETELLYKLHMADKAMDVAQNELCSAKHATGKDKVNPLDNSHPAVINKKKAVLHRQLVMAEVEQHFSTKELT